MGKMMASLYKSSGLLRAHCTQTTHLATCMVNAFAHLIRHARCGGEKSPPPSPPV